MGGQVLQSRGMFLTHVECRTFRRLSELSFDPVPGLNVLRGGNAQGKTTVLEAVLCAATSKSHRTTSDVELVQRGTDGFRIKASAQRRDRMVDIETNFWRGAKRFKVNGVAQTRISDVLGHLNAVFFSPEDLDLIKGGAAGRRRFLDMELSQICPAYLLALQQYRQTLRQRNELLRGEAPDRDLLDVYDEQLVRHGRAVMEERRAYLAELAPLAAEAYARIAGGESMTAAYCSDVKPGDDFARVLAKSRDHDLRRGQTHRGPHRDEVELMVAGVAAREFGSQGQQKTAALALRLAEHQLAWRRTGEWPVLMLDEVLAELDARRARALFASIGPETQCLVTTTERTGPREGLFERAASFRIEEGRLEKEEE